MTSPTDLTSQADFDLALTVDELSARILANIDAVHDCVVPIDGPMADWERELAGLTFMEAYGFNE